MGVLTYDSLTQILLLTRAMEDLEKEKMERNEEKVRYLAEKLPPLQLSELSMDEMQVSRRGGWHRDCRSNGRSCPKSGVTAGTVVTKG